MPLSRVRRGCMAHLQVRVLVIGSPTAVCSLHGKQALRSPVRRLLALSPASLGIAGAWLPPPSRMGPWARRHWHRSRHASSGAWAGSGCRQSLGHRSDISVGEHLLALLHSDNRHRADHEHRKTVSFAASRRRRWRQPCRVVAGTGRHNRSGENTSRWASAKLHLTWAEERPRGPMKAPQREFGARRSVGAVVAEGGDPGAVDRGDATLGVGDGAAGIARDEWAFAVLQGMGAVRSG